MAYVVEEGGSDQVPDVEAGDGDDSLRGAAFLERSSCVVGEEGRTERVLVPRVAVACVGGEGAELPDFLEALDVGAVQDGEEVGPLVPDPAFYVLGGEEAVRASSVAVSAELLMEGKGSCGTERRSGKGRSRRKRRRKKRIRRKKRWRRRRRRRRKVWRVNGCQVRKGRSRSRCSRRRRRDGKGMGRRGRRGRSGMRERSGKRRGGGDVVEVGSGYAGEGDGERLLVLVRLRASHASSIWRHFFFLWWEMRKNRNEAKKQKKKHLRDEPGIGGVRVARSLGAEREIGTERKNFAAAAGRKNGRGKKSQF